MEPNNFYIGKNSIHFGVYTEICGFFPSWMFTILSHTLTYAHSGNSDHYMKTIVMNCKEQVSAWIAETTM